ncbi:hypothetical protein C1645_735565 [Glomus cerebriforme]|uniref:Uncharacterized protein n=1 Tax=Glomus cerebriforme TaxID=658196 RepID=A0A397T986_9GLOM|nr:hypothetical protein C1645_735565 [Glomus cerebriforme]
MSETSTPYTPASTSISVTRNETVSLADEIKKYDTVKLIEFLKGQDLNLVKDDFDIIKNERVGGQNFLDMTSDWYFLMYTPERIYCLKDDYHIVLNKKILKDDAELHRGVKKVMIPNKNNEGKVRVYKELKTSWKQVENNSDHLIILKNFHYVYWLATKRNRVKDILVKAAKSLGDIDITFHDMTMMVAYKKLRNGIAHKKMWNVGKNQNIHDKAIELIKVATDTKLITDITKNPYIA